MIGLFTHVLLRVLVSTGLVVQTHAIDAIKTACPNGWNYSSSHFYHHVLMKWYVYDLIKV